MTRRRTALSLGALVVFTTWAATARAGDAREAQLLHLLEHDCGSCHGMRLTGGLGPPLTAEALRDRPLAYLQRVILDGIPGSPMPPWRPYLSARDARWLAVYLRSGAVPGDEP